MGDHFTSIADTQDNEIRPPPLISEQPSEGKANNLQFHSETRACTMYMTKCTTCTCNCNYDISERLLSGYYMYSIHFAPPKSSQCTCTYMYIVCVYCFKLHVLSDF